MKVIRKSLQIGQEQNSRKTNMKKMRYCKLRLTLSNVYSGGLAIESTAT